MANLITADDLRSRFDIDSEIEDGRLDPAIGSASLRLRGWVGDDAYTDALSNTPADEVRKSAFENAEAHLAMHFAILGLNTPISFKGVVATAMSAEGKEMRKYLTPADSLAVSEQYLEFARRIVNDYVIADDNATFDMIYGD